ncbi:MAG TPA: LysR family transcriptional regulator [Gammaproteobacteria bacterium]|nr:LysR family transcriptional regulator [Gammaproteobacteria bacterium]
MLRENATDLVSFLAVARDESFTKAAAHLGVSQSALSQSIRGLEERLGVRLLSRTTRRVAPTAAGERLREAIAPRFEAIESELLALSELRERPSGTIRLTAIEHAADTLLLPKLAKFLPEYPEIEVEITIDYGLTDIVGQHFDAGVRAGELIEKDMIAVRIGPDLRMAVVGSPDYFAQRALPKEPRDLTDHNCINLRLPTHGEVYAWEFEDGTRELNVRVSGQLMVNNTPQLLNSARAGLGLAYVPEDLVQEDLSQGRLQRVLEDWCHPYPGYHLYYPNRRQASRAFSLVVEALRYSD